jgi:hypothetical protein
MGANPELRNKYRATWDDFSRKLDIYQSCVEAGDYARAETALLEVEQARMAYNSARDCLAQHLTSRIAAVDLKSIAIPEQRRVRQTAHLLWELAGKPHGTADSDWRRAENLVRTASASAC